MTQDATAIAAIVKGLTQDERSAFSQPRSARAGGGGLPIRARFIAKRICNSQAFSARSASQSGTTC